MQTIILPTAYLPSLAYYVCLVQNTSVIIDLHEHYIKQSCRNRCYIYSANGALPLVIPVHKTTGNHTLVRDIEICYLQRWQSNHWRAIESAYQSSPYFLYYKDELRYFYQRHYAYLADFNRELLELLVGLVKATVEPGYSGEYCIVTDQSRDLRNKISVSDPYCIGFQFYHQVFQHKYGFIPNLSILDVLFNLGPAMNEYTERQNFSNIR